VGVAVMVGDGVGVDEPPCSEVTTIQIAAPTIPRPTTIARTIVATRHPFPFGMVPDVRGSVTIVP
jgi:hypothetical protein